MPRLAMPSATSTTPLQLELQRLSSNRTIVYCQGLAMCILEQTPTHRRQLCGNQAVMTPEVLDDNLARRPSAQIGVWPDHVAVLGLTSLYSPS